MRPASAHILPVLLALSCLLAGCAHHGRVIPEEKMARIYRDMFLSDQWVRDVPGARVKADTTLFFDPIFKRYGYSFEDYDRSIHYYLDHPEKYSKILNNASERLRRESERLSLLQADRRAVEQERDRLHELYATDWNFRDESQCWEQDRILWPVAQEPADTAAAVSDSLVLPEGLDLPPIPSLRDSIARMDSASRKQLFERILQERKAKQTADSTRKRRQPRWVEQKPQSELKIDMD